MKSLNDFPVISRVEMKQLKGGGHAKRGAEACLFKICQNDEACLVYSPTCTCEWRPFFRFCMTTV